MKTIVFVAATMSILSVIPNVALSQEAAADSSQRLLVFIDCNVPNCDFDHLRREITWVNWVRDREDSDLHILTTWQFTGSQGFQYTLDYLGRRAFEGVGKSLGYTSDPDDTDSEVRDALTNVIALGLVQYVERTPTFAELRLQHTAREVTDATTEETDPWNLWTFRLGSDASIEGETSERQYQFAGFVRADRVAEDFKINLEFGAEYEREEFDDLEEGETFINTTVDWETGVQAVWSLTDRWSAGARVQAEKSTFRNKDLELTGGPAIQYNVFPWAESTRRSVTFAYVVELAHFNYELTTIEGRLSETRARHIMAVSAAVQQPWGELFGSIEGIQYFHDLSTHKIETFLFLEYRLFRGFNIDIFASFDRIKDQFFLPAGGLTPEEILVRRRQRETSFRFDFGFGFSYRFGSRFANVVNPRLF